VPTPQRHLNSSDDDHFLAAFHANPLRADADSELGQLHVIVLAILFEIVADAGHAPHLRRRGLAQKIRAGPRGLRGFVIHAPALGDQLVRLGLVGDLDAAAF